MATFIKIYGHGLYVAHEMPLCTFSFGEQHMDPQRMVVYTNFPTHVYSLRGIYWWSPVWFETKCFSASLAYYGVEGKSR